MPGQNQLAPARRLARRPRTPLLDVELQVAQQLERHRVDLEQVRLQVTQ